MKIEKKYFVYILECSDKSFYTGITTDLERRVIEHNSSGNLGAKYTKMRQPVRLIYNEKVKNKSEALKREYSIRQLKRKGKEELVEKKYLQANHFQVVIF